MKEISYGFSNVKSFKSLLFQMTYGYVCVLGEGRMQAFFVNEGIVMDVFLFPDYFLIQLRLSPLVA